MQNTTNQIVWLNKTNNLNLLDRDLVKLEKIFFQINQVPINKRFS